ncbi:MAG: hypothetical protein IPK19_15395 [Chloroflexi bacterium]|nr:hypothetical protein [Chloroflexota bacterium]
MPILYLISVPTTDPDDVSLRALRLIRESSAVAVAESDRPSLTALLKHHQIAAQQLIALDEVAKALETGDVALIAAGNAPAVADEVGARIVRDAITRGLRVEPIPGVSLPITALVLSALPPDTFVYVGRLPDASPSDGLMGYEDDRATLVMTLRADRLPAALETLRGAFGDRPACLVYRPGAPDGLALRGPLSSLMAPEGLSSAEDVALVLGGAPERPQRRWTEDEVRAALEARLDAGDPLKVAAKAIAAESGWDRRSVYALGIED